MKVAENTMENEVVYQHPMHCTKVKSLLNEHLIFGFKAVNSHCQLVMFNISRYFASRVDGACYKVLIFEFNAFLLTNSLFGASSHDHRWEGGSSVTK